MSESKSFATLTPTLLARKGGAKPAMRPQVQPLHEFHEATARDMADDLGWNDMGSASADEANAGSQELGAEVVLIGGDKHSARTYDLPEVVQQQAGLSERVSKRGRVRQSALVMGRRAAFTLRLDAERHLKLRLAKTMLDRSAQDIVTEALDSYLAGLSEIDSLAETIRKRR